MFWVLLSIAAVLVAAIAVGTVLIVSSRLNRTEWVASYDLTAAKELVLSQLPDAVAERLTPEGVELILAWHLDYLRSLGVATFGQADALAAGSAERSRRRAVTASPAGEQPADRALDVLSQSPSPPHSPPADQQPVDSWGEDAKRREEAAHSPPAGEQPVDRALDVLLRRARDAEVEFDALDIALVLEEVANYLAQIGAVGDEVV